MSVRPRSLPLVAASLVTVLLLAWWVVRPADGADPSAGAPAAGSAPAAPAAGSDAGRVRYVDLDSGGADVTLPIRSFAWQVELDATPGGGGGGGTVKAEFSAPHIVQDVSFASPLLMELVATGGHIPSVKVVLYRPSSTTPRQQWIFGEPLLTLSRHTTSGGSVGTETVELTYETVEQSIFKPDGVTVSRSFCYDVVAQSDC